MKTWNRRIIVVLSALIALTAAVCAGYAVSAHILKNRVVQALGPGSEIRAVRIGWKGVEIDGLRIKGMDGWPAEDALRAERVRLVPSLTGLFTGDYRISSITITGPYISIYKTKDGKTLAVPTLIHGEEKENPAEGSSRKISLGIGRITIENGVVEYFDAAVSRIPVKIRLEGIRAGIDNLSIPALDTKSTFTLDAMVRGNTRNGRVKFTGWANLSSLDSSVHLQLGSVDLTALQPYLVKSGDSKVQKGLLDLDLQSDVRSSRLKAPGTVVLSDLRLAPARGLFGTFMGVPRDAVLSLMKDQGNRITLHFILEGDIRNPKFSLKETLTQRLAVSMAETLKVSVGGVVKGAGSLGEKGVETASGVVKGIGGAMQGLFGKSSK